VELMWGRGRQGWAVTERVVFYCEKTRVCRLLPTFAQPEKYGVFGNRTSRGGTPEAVSFAHAGDTASSFSAEGS
jgi:hypothetical protein